MNEMAEGAAHIDGQVQERAIGAALSGKDILDAPMYADVRATHDGKAWSVAEPRVSAGRFVHHSDVDKKRIRRPKYPDVADRPGFNVKCRVRVEIGRSGRPVHAEVTNRIPPSSCLSISGIRPFISYA